MDNCIFENNICIKCGFESRYPNVKRNCKPISRPPIRQGPQPQKKSPSLARKLVHFGQAMVKSGLQGFKMCSQEQINERFKICKGCEAYSKKTETEGQCQDCGCSISLEPVFLNKLNHKSESCPKQKWGPIEKKENNNEETIPSEEASQLQQGGCRPCQR